MIAPFTVTAIEASHMYSDLYMYVWVTVTVTVTMLVFPIVIALPFRGILSRARDPLAFTIMDHFIQGGAGERGMRS